MKVMRKTVLASSLMMLPSLAQALGLGAIEVKSALNQPLNAEISVIQANAGEAAGLAVDLAKAEDFARVGIDRTRLSVPLEFAVGQNARGEPVIRVTSSEPIREPFLTFLLDVNWESGRLLREYTVLLDPPVMAPARRGSAVATAPATRPAPAARPEPIAQAAPAPAAQAAPPTAAAPAPTPPAPAPVARPVPAATAASEYGPVSSGETLWEVATATRPAGVEDMNRLMVTLLRMNPDAFYQDNINALKRGAVLRIPSATEVNAISVAEASEAVRQQNEIWRGYQERAAGRTTALADAGGARPSASGSAGASADSRLELVPPRAASGDQGGADRPGSGALDSSSAALRETRADLARTQEDLASARQEATELRSRVADLEKIKTDQDRLLSLRDSELAAMQARLAELEKQAQAAAAAASVAPVTVSEPSAPVEPDVPAAPADSVSAQDIWGAPDDAAEPDDTAVADGSTEPAMDEPVVDEPVTDEPADEPLVADTDTTPAVTQPVSEPVAVTPEPVAPPVPAQPWYQNYYLLGGAAAALLALIGVVASRRRKTAAEDEFSVPADADDAVDFGIPASAAAQAVDDGDFLYELQSRLSADPADLDAHLQLLRHLYAQGDERGFEHAASAMLAQVDDQHGPEWSEARSLGEALLPGNPLFAAPSGIDDFDATSFEESPTAETEVHADADDALGFDAFDEPDVTTEVPASSFESAAPERAGSVEPGAASEPAALDFDFDFESPTQVIEPVKPAVDAVEERLDFDSVDNEVEQASLVEDKRLEAEFGTAMDRVATSEAAKVDDLELPALDFDFSLDAEVKRPEVVGLADTSADMDFDVTPPTPVVIEPSAPVMVEPAQDQDDFLDLDFGSLGESDAVGTKLDLARAYIDMGDPEGARSMLEEVIAEGNSGQRADAEKLMATLG